MRSVRRTRHLDAQWRLNLAYLFVYDDMGQINRMDCRTALPRRIGYVRFSVFRMLQCNV
jgi:hypothetical protein